VRAGHLVAVNAGVVVALVAAVLSTPAAGEPELRAAIRLTALTSTLLFLSAFSASAWHRLWPGATATWLLANRRYLGLSFACSHLGHGVLLVILAQRIGDRFWTATSPGTLAGGGLGYLFLATMVLTSNDRAVATLGRRLWSRLHTAGLYYLWFIFVFTYAGPAARSPFHALMVAALVGAWLLRATARSRSSHRHQASAV
jgi:hypothetical protein